LIDQQQAIQSRLDDVEEKLAGFVGFDAEHKSLAGCFVSIGQDGTPFIDKGLVRPEQRKQLAKLLKTDSSDEEQGKAKPKHALAESLRRDLAAQRLQVAQVEIAGNPAIALDLLAFKATSKLLSTHPVSDGPDVVFSRIRAKPGVEHEPTIATSALALIEQALPIDWLNAAPEAARFDAFRSLPEASKLALLAYVVALTLKPNLAPAEGDEVTAYDAALSLTDASMAGYWRPTKDNFLGRITRDQLLTVGRDALGEPWAQSHFAEKKSLLVEQLDRAFSNPEKSGRTPDQIEKLKSWLPQGMSFEIAAAPKPAHSRKARKAA
jgi:ParB family chromosome partitioning protein